MKRRKWYLIIQKSNKHIFGAFPRTKDGKIEATKYMKKLYKGKKSPFIIK